MPEPPIHDAGQQSNRAAVALEANAEHGRWCNRSDGTLKCGWPEKHDPTFAPELPPGDVPLSGLARTHLLVGHLVTALMVAGAVAALALGLLIHGGTVHLQTVVSGSMRPTISPGDVAVTQAVPVDSLHVGDVIAFFPPGQTLPVLHRIQSLAPTDSGESITTRGDANNADDPWHATLQGTTAYRLVAVVPFVGWLTQLERPALILAAVLMALAVLRELGKGVKSRRANHRPQSQS